MDVFTPKEQIIATEAKTEPHRGCQAGQHGVGAGIAQPRLGKGLFLAKSQKCRGNVRGCGSLGGLEASSLGGNAVVEL